MLVSHEDLVSELPKLEKLNASERKKLNDNRRAAQLERWKKSQSEGNFPIHLSKYPILKFFEMQATMFELRVSCLQ